MTKHEFTQKYLPDPPSQFASKMLQHEMNKLRGELEVEIKSDLNEVIKDELKNFAKFINGNTTSHLFDEITKGDINSYLNQ